MNQDWSHLRINPTRLKADFDALAEIGKPQEEQDGQDFNDDISMEEVLGIAQGLQEAQDGKIRPLNEIEADMEKEG